MSTEMYSISSQISVNLHSASFNPNIFISFPCPRSWSPLRRFTRTCSFPPSYFLLKKDPSIPIFNTSSLILRFYKSPCYNSTFLITSSVFSAVFSQVNILCLTNPFAMSLSLRSLSPRTSSILSPIISVS